MAGMFPESDKDFARQMFVDFDEELGFWRDNYQTSPFHREGMEFRHYEPAVKLGINVFLRSHGRTFEELKAQLADSYERTRGNSPLEWCEASVAAGAAWDRMAAKLASRVSYHARAESKPTSQRAIRGSGRTVPPQMP